MAVKRFKKIMVANRGEIAVRILKTARKLGFKTVSLYSKADSDSIHRSMADESYYLGDSLLSESYLNIEKIIKLAKVSGSDAIHPGYGLLSENDTFAKRIEEEGLIFIGPGHKAISIMGDKAKAKREMEKIGVPCIPGYQGTDQSDKKFIESAKEIGYPLLIKASRGGGGRGMRIVESEEEMKSALDMARKESLSAFGSEELILEKLILNPRHIEIQVIADQFGKSLYLGERDCSIQRRHQKIVEEAPSDVLDNELREKFGKTAIEIAKSIHYVGVGTVEFLLDEDKNFYFMEMNTRLQVEHTVTEMVTGIDLVEKQFEIAKGLPLELEQDLTLFRGHSIEVRLYAEDPDNDFSPQTGKVVLWKEAEGEGIRIDNGLFSGIHITPFYDPMIAKIISWGKNREQARLILIKALLETNLFGIKTNKEFLLNILQNRKFIEGEITTSFLNNFEKNHREFSEEEQFKIACIGACLEYEFKRESFLKQSLMVSDELRNWTSSKSLPFFVHYKIGEKNWYLSILPKPFENDSYEVFDNSDGFISSDSKDQYKMVKVKIINKDDSIARVEVNNSVSLVPFHFSNGEKSPILYFNFEGKDLDFLNLWTKLDSITEKEDDGIILSPMHGILSEILVSPGDIVKKGQIVAIVEAMKMQNELRSKVNGKIKGLYQVKGKQVSLDEKLMDIEVDE